MSDAPRHLKPLPERLPNALPRALRDFLDTEVAGGVVLLVAAAVAIVWANSPLSGAYESLWEHHLTLGTGGWAVDHDVRHWINDGLMTIFFFVAGLEIKRELVKGELRDPRRAALPVIAALGGMVLPALIYIALNIGGEGSRGWGIPMATDIAFALGLLALLGPRVPSSLKVFLLTLAIADDIGAILVIAFFYSTGVEFAWLAAAAIPIGVTLILRARRVVSSLAYLALGVMLWFVTLESGVHATIAGVVLGLITPARPFDPAARLSEDVEDDIQSSPADRLIHIVHPYSSYIVIPLFALANAGIILSKERIDAALSSSITAGVVLGLVVGKLVGVTGFAWLATKLRLATVPEDFSWALTGGVASLAGVGFTVSLFVADLAFSEGLAQQARMGVVAGSLVAALLGVGLIKWALGRRGESEQTPR